MALTKAKISFVEGLDGAVLTGAMPALDGSSLTGIAGMTKVTSDPLITTNPSSGVGTTWVNKSSGEMFICTDATANANVWINIGGGFGNYGKSFGGKGPGTVAGYTACGYDGSQQNIIDKFTFGSANNAGDHGDISVARFRSTGHSSQTHGYAASGETAINCNIIDKFPFAAGSGAVDHGDLSVGVRYGKAAGASSATDGYSLGGQLNSTSAFTSVIQRFNFTSNSTSNTHGNLTVPRNVASGHSSDTHGYASAGSATSPALEVTIDKFVFASESDATDHGDLLVARYGGCGHSSTTDGYTTGGHTGPRTDAMDKFAFASNVTASDHGNLVVIAAGKSGQSSTTHGYASGGYLPPIMAGIDKFAFGSANNATDHGDLTVARSWGAGSQY